MVASRLMNIDVEKVQAPRECRVLEHGRLGVYRYLTVHVVKMAARLLKGNTCYISFPPSEVRVSNGSIYERQPYLSALMHNLRLVLNGPHPLDISP